MKSQKCKVTTIPARLEIAQTPQKHSTQLKSCRLQTQVQVTQILRLYEIDQHKETLANKGFSTKDINSTALGDMVKQTSIQTENREYTSN